MLRTTCSFSRLLARSLNGAPPTRRRAFCAAAAGNVAAADAVTAPSVLRWAVLPWSFFIGENVILSHNRSSLIDYLGDEERYHMLYNGVSTVACVSLGFGYFYRLHSALPLRPVSALAIGASFVLQALGLAGLSQTLPRVQTPFAPSEAVLPATRADPSPAQWVVRCPMDFRGETNKEVTSPDGLHGLHRVSRHPMLWSLACVGLGAALAVPSVPQAVWLCGPALMALLGGAHIDFRHRRQLGGTLTAEDERVTSHLPFVAMASGAHAEGALGSARALFDELKAENAAIATLVAARWALGRGRR